MQLPPDATGTVATTTTSHYRNDEYRPYLPKQDPYLVNRLVGFHEYSQALQLLDALYQSATSAELDVIDEIVKAEPEFTVYTNLSRRVDLGRTTLVEKPERAGDDFARRGIRWVTALARVELAAMLAGYTEHPQPCAAMAGPGYDVEQYRELIVDGAKMHFWSWTNDPGVEGIFRQFQPGSRTLAYLRRLNVANAFVLAAAMAGGFAPNSPQTIELFGYGERLGKARAVIRGQIETYLATVSSNSRSFTGSTSQVELLEMCRSGACRQFSSSANPPPKTP